MRNFYRNRRARRETEVPWAPDLVAAQRSFGFRLHALLTDQFPGRNIFFSPADLGSALALLYNGSGESTRIAIAGALGFRDKVPERMDRFFRALKDHLQSPAGEVDLAQATALWVRAGLALNDEFVRRGREWFDIRVSPVDFSDPQTKNAMDTWVKNKTRGLIGNTAGAIDPETILLLTSALYFKGLWALPFDPQQTREHAFTTHDGSRKLVPMMHKSSKFHYLEKRGFQAVRLDYKGSPFSLQLFLPDEQSDLQRFQAGLTAANWGRWMGQLKPLPGTVLLPRFQVKFDANLHRAFEAMGLGVLFDPASAQLEGLMSDGTTPFLSGVQHQAVVDLDEEGTEAAAATDLLIPVSYTPKPPKTFLMQVDRPFFFAIQDNTAGIPLFFGSVLDLGSA